MNTYTNLCVGIGDGSLGTAGHCVRYTMTECCQMIRFQCCYTVGKWDVLAVFMFGAYLIDYSGVCFTNGLQPAFTQQGRLLGDTVEMAVVVGASVARTKLAVRKATCCWHNATCGRT